MPKPVVPYSAVIALDVNVLLRVARLNIVQADAPFLGPSSEFDANKFRASITANCLRLSTPFYNLIQSPHDTLRWKRKNNFHADGLPVEVVNQIEKPKTSPARQLIVHEIHRPALVAGFRNSKWLGLLAQDAFVRLDTQIQFQLAVNTVNPWLLR